VKSLWLKFGVLAAMLLGLPMLGIVTVGYPVARYLEFPPETRYVLPAPFSWLVFAAYALFIIAAVLPLVWRVIRTIRETGTKPAKPRSFPWWGWLGIISGAVSWILAWTRFAWFAPLQPHTFILLWLSYILVINALCYRRTGHCMLIDRPRFFALLFPASAAFEYLNSCVFKKHVLLTCGYY